MKTVCVYHSRDLDGWMSAAIVKHWWKQDCASRVPQITFMNRENVIITPFDVIVFIGWDYGNPIPNLEEYDKVIMVDISFPVDEMDELFEKLDASLVWIDHHISAIKANGELDEWEIEDVSTING